MAATPFAGRRNPVLAALERGDTPLGMQMFTHATCRNIIEAMKRS